MIEWTAADSAPIEKTPGDQQLIRHDELPVIYLDAEFQEGRTGWQANKKLLAVDHGAQLISFRENFRIETPDQIATGYATEYFHAIYTLRLNLHPFS